MTKNAENGIFWRESQSSSRSHHQQMATGVGIEGAKWERRMLVKLRNDDDDNNDIKAEGNWHPFRVFE